MTILLHQVDAFTDRPYAGNPAAVCLLDEPGDPAWMQRVASEMNLSETAFVVPRDEGFVLRWFTPTTEVDLCGHATVAAAHASPAGRSRCRAASWRREPSSPLRAAENKDRELTGTGRC